MNNKDLEKGITALFDSIENSQNNEHFDDANKLKDSIDIYDPESFFFQTTYHDEITKKLALKLKLQESNENYQINKRYDQIYFNYNKVENFISGLIQDFEGFACCADKARHIVHIVMKKNFYVNNYYKINNNGYWTPKYRNTADWETLIFAFLNVRNQKSIEQLLEITLKIQHNYTKVTENRTIFYSQFYNEILKNNYLCNIPILDVKKKKITINEYIQLQNQLTNNLTDSNYHQAVVYYLSKIEPTLMKDLRKMIPKQNKFISF